MKSAIFAAIFLMMVSGSLAGRITAWGDIEVYNPNKGYITYIDLYVTLDTKLPAGHIMRITLPFTTAPTIGTITAYSGATSKGTFFATPATPAGTSAATSTSVKTSSASPFNYYWSFSADLAASTNYVLRVPFTTSPTDVGFLGYIQLETMSPAGSITGSASDLPITYDLNNAFAPLHIAAAPGNLTLTSTADANATVAGASSLRQFKITPSQNFYYWPTIVLSWANSAYSLSNLVSIDIGTNSSAVTPLTLASTGATTVGQYSFSTSGTSLVILHNQVLTAAVPITYNVTVANPSATNTATFSVQIYHRYNYNLTDVTATTITNTVTATTTSSSSTTAAVVNQQVLLSWGIDRNASTITGSPALQKVFQIYATPTTNPQYQAINFVFGLNASVTSASLYKVSVGVCSAIANCDVLENSIVSNITGASCSLTYATSLSIYCNVTSLSLTGNSIAARIFMAGTSTGTLTISGTQAAGYTMSDTTFGTIGIASYNTALTTTTSVVTTSGQASSPYTTTTYQFTQLANINGNGPLVMLPISGSPPGAAAQSYSTLWTTPGSASNLSAVTSTSGTPYTAWPATIPAVTVAGGNIMGGIYASTTAGLKYNVGLYTLGQMFAASASAYSSFSSTAGSGSASTLAQVCPGIDIFMNPNLFASAGSTANQITTCYANNLAVRNPTSWSSSSTDTAGTSGYAHCYSNVVSSYYLRLRYLFASKLNTAGFAATAGSNAAGAIESVTTGTLKFMSFFWESAVNITTAYSGSSLKADSSVPDFYGIFYTMTFSTPGTNTPSATGSGTVSDLGELSTSITNLASISYGYPLFWNQMIMGPYGTYVAAATNNYYGSKSVWIANYDSQATTADSYTSNNFISYLRVRGLFQTGSSGLDVGLVPTGGRTALFLNIPNGQTQFEGLGAAGFVTGSTASSYSAGTAINLGTIPLVGNGAIRCWSSAGYQNCTLDRRGRAMPSAINTGIISPIDLYQIITSDVAYSSNFSLVIAIKPKMLTTANYNLLTYRWGFQATTGMWYIQTWDQVMDNLATTASATGVVTQAQAAPFTATTISGAPTAAASTCAIPYTTTSTTVPGIRLVPGATETDNTLLSATTTLAINTITAVTPSLKQGAISWCVQWNFKASSSFSISAQTALENSTLGDKCQAFDYMSENTTSWYCIYCPIAGSSNIPAQSAATSPISLTLNSFTTGTATNILSGSWSTVTTDAGNLQDLGQCSTITGPGAANNATNPYVWLTNTITGVSASGSAFNLQGQKVTVSFTAPSTIASTMVDSITLTGRNQTATTADSSFPWGSLDSSYVCRLVPTASATNYSQMQSCTAAISGGVLTVTPTIAATYASTTSWTLILWGLNGATSSASSPTATNFYIQTSKSSTLVDSSNTTNSALASWALATSPSLNFTTANVGYQRPIIGARGWFRFDFTFSSRNWFYGDKIVLSVDGIVTSTSNSNTSIVKCRITDTSDVIQFNFQSCTLVSSTTPATLTIYALSPSYASGSFDFTAGNGYRVYLENMVTIAAQTNKVIYGSIYFNGGSSNAALTKNTTGTDISSSALTTAQTMTTPVLTKYFAAANDYQDMAFSLTTASAFSSAGRITIAFPSYYNPGLAAAVYCTINNVYVMCAVGSITSAGVNVLANGQRSLVVWGYSGSFAAGASFVLKVGGIRAPPASYTVEQFYAQINTDNSESTSTISSAIAFNDTAYSAQTVVPLNVNWFTIGTTATRTTTTVTWTFGLNGTTTVNTSQAITVYFPETWGVAWGFFTPTCTVMDATNTSLTYASSQSQFGNLIQLNVSTAIPTAAVVVLSCQNVRVPDADGTYLGNHDITIRVTDQNGTSVYQRSAPGMNNVNWAYAFKSSLLYLSWNITGSMSSPAALTAGTYNLPVALSITSLASSNRTFTITPANSQFSFLSTTAPFYLTTGTVSNSTLLGCAGSVPVGIYGLTFTVSDTTMYTTAPKLWIWVNSNQQTITPSATTMTTYYIASTVTSYAPLVFDATMFPPYSDITITPVLSGTATNTNFTFTPSSIKLTPGAPKNYFTFSTTSAVTAATGAATYTFALSGTNAASYTIPASVSFALTADTTSSNTGTPTLAVSADSTDTSAATSKILTLTLSGVTQATIYWALTLQGQSITDATAIQTAAAALTAYNANSANQAQYGTFYQYVSPSKTPSNFAVSGLFPNTGYTLTAVALSLANKTSTVASYTFVTGSNTASIQRWLFNYTTYPTQAQRQTLLCSITQMLAVPAINVRSVNGEICGNTTAFYNSSNSTGDLGVYFYPLQVASDTVMPNLATNFNTTAKLTTLNTTTSSGTSGTGFTLPVLPDGTIKNLMPSATFPSSASVGQTWASFSGISLNDTGFVFIAIAANTTSAPSAVAFKQAAAGIVSTTGLSQIQVLYYYPAGGSLSYNFTGLSAATTYNAFLLASNNDPSFLQNFTSVSTVAFTTSSTGSTTGSPIGVIFSVMAIFVSVISLMFF